MTWLNSKVVQPDSPAGRCLRQDVEDYLTKLGHPELAAHSGYQGSSDGLHHFHVIFDPMAKKPYYEFSIPCRPETEPGLRYVPSGGTIARDIIESTKAWQALAEQEDHSNSLLMRY